MDRPRDGRYVSYVLLVLLAGCLCIPVVSASRQVSHSVSPSTLGSRSAAAVNGAILRRDHLTNGSQTNGLQSLAESLGLRRAQIHWTGPSSNSNIKTRSWQAALHKPLFRTPPHTSGPPLIEKPSYVPREVVVEEERPTMDIDSGNGTESVRWGGIRLGTISHLPLEGRHLLIVTAAFTLVAAIAVGCLCAYRFFAASAGEALGDAVAGGLHSSGTEDITGSGPQLPQPQFDELRRRRLKLLIEHAASKSKLERLVAEVGAVEAQLGGGAPSAPPIEQEADLEPTEAAARSMRSAEKWAEHGLASALAYAVPLVSQSARVYEALEKRLAEAQVRARRLAYEEAREACGAVSAALGCGDLTAETLRELADHELPSLGVLLASALAPAQLRLLHVQNKVAIAFKASSAMLTIAVLVCDWDLACKRSTWAANLSLTESPIYSWFAVDFCVSTFCLVVRGQVLAALSASLQGVSYPQMVTQENPVRAVRYLLDYHLSIGGHMLLALDAVGSSWLFYFADWTVVFDTSWMVYGTHLILNHPWSWCSRLGVPILRLRVLFFLTLLIPHLVLLVLFVVRHAVQSHRAHLVVFSAAHLADEFLGLGLPACKVLAHALLVRDAEDMLALQIRMHQLERTRLEQERSDAEAALRAIERQREHKDQLISGLRARREADGNRERICTEDDLARARREVLDHSEALFNGLNERAKLAAERAEVQVRKWEDGDGPEVFQALARGEAWERATELLRQGEAAVEQAADGMGATAQLSDCHGVLAAAQTWAPRDGFQSVLDPGSRSASLDADGAGLQAHDAPENERLATQATSEAASE